MDEEAEKQVEASYTSIFLHEFRGRFELYTALIIVI